MSWIDMLKILAVTCGLMGVALNIKKERLCFLLWFVSNGCWAWLTRAEYLLSVQFAVFGLVCLYGFFAWGRSRKRSIHTYMEVEKTTAKSVALLEAMRKHEKRKGKLPNIPEYPPMPPVKPPRDKNSPPLITARLSELTFQGTVQDAETIDELKRRLKGANLVMERLLYKLRHTRPGATKLRGIKKKR